MKKILLILGGLIFVIVISAGVSFLLINATSKGKININLGSSKPAQKVFGPITDVGEFTVNLQGDSSFLKTDIALEMADKTAADQLQNLLPVVKDAIISVLSTKSLNDVQSANGKKALRLELLNKINNALGGSQVKDVLFTSYVYQ